MLHLAHWERLSEHRKATSGGYCPPEVAFFLSVAFRVVIGRTGAHTVTQNKRISYEKPLFSLEKSGFSHPTEKAPSGKLSSRGRCAFFMDTGSGRFPYGLHRPQGSYPWAEASCRLKNSTRFSFAISLADAQSGLWNFMVPELPI